MSTIDLSSLNHGDKLSWPRAFRRPRSAFSLAGIVAALVVVVATVIVAGVLLSVRFAWSTTGANVTTRLQTDLVPAAAAAEVDPFAVQKANARIEELPAQF